MAELIKMENIYKTFPGVKALTDVSFDLRKGELHAMLGENGAGKSTLMKILTGVYTCDSGKIIFKGEEVSIRKPKDAQSLGINIIHQEFSLFPDLSVSNNIFIGREPRNEVFNFVIMEKKLKQKTREILESLHLNIDPDTLVKDLSVAQQQMVEIARVLSMNSEVVVMDEPTAALTEKEVEELFRVIKELKSRGIGIVYISHRLEELKHIADRVTVMRDGRYIKTVDYDESLLEDLIASMVGRSLEDKFPPHHNVSKGKVILEVEHMASKTIHDIKDFKLYEGEILGIYGLVGAGRTEFARALFGADETATMTVKIHGENVKIKSPRDAIKNGIGYLTEDRKRDGLALGLSVEDNMVLANIPELCRMGVVNVKECREIAERYTADLKIKTPNLEQKAKFLSGGNQQKVILAKWLCRKSHVLIFDEPTRGIDVGSKFEVYELMNKLVALGVGVIMISSELPEVLGMSDRILVMRGGRITGEAIREVATQEKLLAHAVQ
ncbi:MULTISPECIES: sugar ABC transporter ATP-binding protein [unclassified Pelosinus]|uniref:sugar ABC transporter ATP-binding protein n=1 Tax=unclassified Pelosinus TaxID=2629460 RepID=UPI0004D16EFA|nr:MULTISPECIES: sugar ABC transporter ATP-binding protein [unclassified Pelosinus]AIF52537.1 Monosaccharide-transporting ATPase [Pelosinus sp. UFO1]GMB01826.1 monosaccharide-transporting ATPase [Pelosinus sp. IPA-1]